MTSSATRSVDLDTPLLIFNRAGDRLSYRDLLNSFLLVGDVGSGKSSAVLSTLLLALMKHGAGLCLPAAKRDDTDGFVKLSGLAGRCDVTVLDFRGTFNPLGYEQSSSRGLPGRIERLVELAVAPIQRESSGSSDRFWLTKAQDVCRACIVLFDAAGMTLSYALLHEAINSIPDSEDRIGDPRWQSRSPIFEALRRVEGASLPQAVSDDVSAAARELLEHCPSLPDKTLGSIIGSASAAFGVLTSGEPGRFLNAASNSWDPVSVCDGCITIIDLPPLLLGPAAATVQRLCLSSLQNVILRRVVGDSTPCVFLLMDEYPIVGAPDADMRFMSVSRSQRGACLIGCQNIGGVREAARASREPQIVSQSLLSLPGVKCFTALTDTASMEWAESVFTKIPQLRASFGGSESDRDKDSRSTHSQSRSSNFSRDLQHDVPAHVLRTLRRGGPENDFQVDAVIGVSGRTWKASRRPSLKVTFDQIRL